MSHLSPSQGFGVYLAIEGVLIALVLWLRYPIQRWVRRRRRLRRERYIAGIRQSIHGDAMRSLLPRTQFDRSPHLTGGVDGE
jgi:hypothetical protein